LFCCACTTQPINKNPKHESSKSHQQPSWVNTPTLPGYIAVVSSAKPQKKGGKQAQRRTALLIARAELAKSVRIHINSVLQTETTTRNNSVSEKSNSKISTHALELQQLTHAKVKAEWLNKETDELFIWFVVPLGNL